MTKKKGNNKLTEKEVTESKTFGCTFKIYHVALFAHFEYLNTVGVV